MDERDLVKVFTDMLSALMSHPQTYVTLTLFARPGKIDVADLRITYETGGQS